ncbi:MAG: rhodanese-like domain-containing protein [Firmicutes bacterium]|nr:rhodanese-like domain-containing protein [Bacillota bacterium]
MFESISVEHLKRLNNPNLIDIRSIEKYNSKHIMNAVNIPLEELLIRPQKYLSKNEKYYIYCRKGIQSRKLCQILINSGYNVVNVSGGYEAWILNE